jgi:glycolate oxidase FAD binding subunit
VSVAVSATGRGTTAAKFVEQCRQTFGDEAAATGDATAQFAIDGQRPAAVCYPANVEELGRSVAAAALANLAMIPVGNGAQLGIGRSPRRYDVAMCTRRMRRVVAHEAADLTVTVEAGTTIDELNASLAAATQFLPLDPPRSNEVTIGGLVATDATGPLRFAYGKVRDVLIGMRAVLADGTIVKAGGRVVKNVAGYDLMKLMAGSHGSLAIVAEATFKVRPRPEIEAVFVVGVERIQDAVAAGLYALSARLQPAFVEAVNQIAADTVGLRAPALIIGCHGSAGEIEAQRHELDSIFGARVEMLDRPRGADLTARLRQLGTTDGAAGCRIVTSVSRLASVLGHVAQEASARSIDILLGAHVGNGVAVLRCPLPRDKAGAFTDFALWLSSQVAAAGGIVTFDALPASLKDRIDPWSTERALPAARRSLMHAIKDALDPRGLLSPGCFVGGI